MIFNIYLIENGTNSVFQIWKAGKIFTKPSWVEVRGDINNYNPDSLFHKIHDLKRINVSDLHCKRIVQILPDWEGYDVVKKAFNS